MNDSSPLGVTPSGPDPIQTVRCDTSPLDPLNVTVTIELAEHVPSWCLNTEAAFVEFHGGGHHVQASFALREGRPAHRLEATVRLPERGTYSYRVVSKIMQRSLAREGTYEVPNVIES